MDIVRDFVFIDENDKYIAVHPTSGDVQKVDDKFRAKTWKTWGEAMEYAEVMGESSYKWSLVAVEWCFTPLNNVIRRK